MNITVYLGASAGASSRLRDATCELAKWIADSGHTLVYGGSKTGLMGTLATMALSRGGRVVGVETRFFMDQEQQLDGLAQLIVTDTMAQRKDKMIELGDAFVAMPGGTGTLEEIAEVMSRVSLGQLDAPCILYNLDGYYDHLRALLATMREAGLSSEARQRGIFFASSLQEIAAILERRQA